MPADHCARHVCAGLGEASRWNRRKSGQLARSPGEAAGSAQGGLRGVAESSTRRSAVSMSPPVARRETLADVTGADLRTRRRGRRLVGRGTRAVSLPGSAKAISCTIPSPITSRPAALFLESGAHALGCAVIPGGVGNTEQQLEAIAHYKPTGYVGTPDFLKILLDTAEKSGKDASSLKRGLVSGAALPASLRDELGRRGVAVLQCYATAELGVIAYESEAPRRHDRERNRHRRNRSARHRRSRAGWRSRRSGRDLVQSATIR